MVNLASGTVKVIDHQDYDYYERICSGQLNQAVKDCKLINLF